MHTRAAWMPRLIVLVMTAVLVGCSWVNEQRSITRTGPATQRPSAADIAAAEDAPAPEILPKTRFAAARLFESTRHFDKAVEQYRKTLAADPGYVEAYHRLGILLGYLGKHQEAETALRRAVQLSPSEGALRNNLAFELILQQRWREAERELRRAIALDPNLDQARTNMGLVLAAQGRFDDAMVEYRRVLREPDALYNLGLAYRTHRRYEDARQTFSRVLAMNPDFEVARRQLDHLPKPRVRPAGPHGDAGSARPPSAQAAAPPAVLTFAPDKTDEVDRSANDAIPTQSSSSDAHGADSPSPKAGGDRLENVQTVADRHDELADALRPPAFAQAHAHLADGPAVADAVPLPPLPPGFAGRADSEPASPPAPRVRRGDFDADGDIDADDLDTFRSCFSGPGVALEPGCEACDFDGDGDIDSLDYRSFQVAESL